jgi:hypothetical protein
MRYGFVSMSNLLKHKPVDDRVGLQHHSADARIDLSACARFAFLICSLVVANKNECFPFVYIAQLVAYVSEAAVWPAVIIIGTIIIHLINRPLI